MIHTFSADFVHDPETREWVAKTLNQQGIGMSPLAALRDALKNTDLNDGALQISSAVKSHQQDPMLREIREWLMIHALPEAVQCSVRHAQDKDEIEVSISWRDIGPGGSLSPNRTARFVIPGMDVACGTWQRSILNSLQGMF